MAVSSRETARERVAGRIALRFMFRAKQIVRRFISRAKRPSIHIPRQTMKPDRLDYQIADGLSGEMYVS